MSREKKILLIIPTSLVMLLVTVSVIIACVGSPQPPVCGNAIFLGKFITETAVAGVEGTIPTGLVPYVSWYVDEEGDRESCPAPNFASVTLSYVCTPDDGSPAFVIGPQMFTLDTPTVPGFQPPGGTTVPFAIPAGIPPSACVIEGTYDVTFATASGGLGFLSDTGDAEIYFVPPSPDDPTLPIVSMEVLTLEAEAGKQQNGAGGVFSGYQGDQQLFFLVLENNDLSREATFTIDGEAIQTAGYADGFTDDESAYHGGNFRISDPNDSFTTEFFHDMTPGSFPNKPGSSKQGNVQIETEVILGPGEVRLVGVAQRSFGACANGSCNENQFSAVVTLTDASGTGKTQDDTYQVGASFATPVDTENEAPGYPGLTIVDGIKMNPDYDAFWTYTEILDGNGDKIDEMHGANLLPAERQPTNRFGIRTTGLDRGPNNPWPATWKDQITVDGVPFTVGARWASFGGYAFDGFALRTTAVTVTGIDPLQGDCQIPHISQGGSTIAVDITINGACGDDALVRIDNVPMGTIGDLRGNADYFVDDASCHTLGFPFGNLSGAPVLVADPPFMNFNVTDKEPFITFVNVTDMEGNPQDWEVTVEGPGADAVTPLNPISNGEAQIEVDPSGLGPLSTLETTLVFTNPNAVNSPLRVPLLVRCQPQQLLTSILEIGGPTLFAPSDPVDFNADLGSQFNVDSFFDPTFLIETDQGTVDIDIQPVNDPPINSIPGSDPLFNDEVQLVFGSDAVDRCADPNRSCQFVTFGGPFVQVNFIIALEGLFPSRDGGVADVTVTGTADNATTTTVTKTFGVLGDDNGLPVITEEELRKAIELFNDDVVFDEKTIGLVSERFGIQEPLPPIRGTYFFDEFESFRKTGAQAPVTVDFASCVPDPTADLFCGFTFLNGGGINGVRIENTPENAVEIHSDSVFVSNNEFVKNHVGVNVISGMGNTITGNTFAGNARGIDLGSDGLTANDDGDGDTGPNHLQNYPVLTEALIGGSSTITGSLNSTPDGTFTLEFFASQTGDCTGENRNGEMLLGSAAVTTGSDGNASFSVVLDSTVARLDYVAATATDAGGNTSELSACVQVVTGVATEGSEEVPRQFALAQNYPNPFNPSTHIHYAVPQASPVRLEVFDMLGRLVALLVDEMKAPGSYEVTFDARGLPSGAYLYTMTGDGFKKTRALMLVK